MSSDSKMLNPYDPVPELATRPKAQPNLQTDSAEAIVLALAETDPIAFVANPNPPLAALFGHKYPVNLECVLCKGEIPDGHTGSCPHWRAVLYKRSKEKK